MSDTVIIFDVRATENVCDDLTLQRVSTPGTEIFDLGVRAVYVRLQ